MTPDKERLEYVLDALEACIDETALQMMAARTRMTLVRGLVRELTTDDLSQGHDDKP